MTSLSIPRLHIAAILAAGLLAMPHSSSASCHTCVPPPGVAAEIAAWVGRETGYPGSLPLPGFRMVPAEAMPRIVAALTGREATGHEFVALYLSGTGEIVLSEDWDARSIRDRSVLVHEMVHHADALTGAYRGCTGETEKHAYAVQSKWLKQHGDSLQAAFGIDAMDLLILTSCAFRSAGLLLS
jgi:hypothetical protein